MIITSVVFLIEMHVTGQVYANLGKHAIITLVWMASVSLQAKPLQITIDPSPGQVVKMQQGSQVILSRSASSDVLMATPEPTDENRVQISFLFTNKGDVSVDIGPESLSGSLSVVSYDQLMEEQRQREKSAKLGVILGAVGNTLTANSSGGYRYQQQAQAGFQSCGYGCVAPYARTQTVRVWDRSLARKAQAEADAQNAARIEQFQAENALARDAIGSNLRTTTLAPGQSMIGVLTFELPRTLRRSKVSQPVSFYVRVGSDLHSINGYAGPIGAGRPSTAGFVQGTVTPSPAAPLVLQATEPASIEAYHRGEYNRSPDKIAELAKAGYSPAQYSLGVMHLYAIGLPLNNAEAVRWLTAASDRGSKEASYALGLYYEINEPSRSVDSLARQYYRLAAARGSTDAKNVLDLTEATPTPPPSNAMPRSPIPANAASYWVTGSDYPVGLNIDGLGGISSFRVDVASNGKVLNCMITASSGHRELDDRTCQLITSRARFHPAVDTRGRPVEGSYSNRVRWSPHRAQ